MDNNKYRQKDREKSNAELRKMFPKGRADIGMIDGEKNSQGNGEKFTKRSKLSHNK
ncbi:hypothetical protein [Clostridium felsineum]|uniref:Uncharacterized protein n=1 Tax=Clostridium felsineum TaxID=36839 RepID=A0A1S8L3R7_9CLOT|nr:hypothetical protein [Clostridium felsineum]URZ09028.1 hypothetical protein CLROS_044340 [Clostridium felsineum]URZ09656.1 hypothetical protein CROST_003390 [Clostridium felsineum]